jgi:hypothetical protein
VSAIIALAAELLRARSKFPSNERLFAALLEEVGELAHEMPRDRQRQREEAIQVACVAIRIAEEGDADFGDELPRCGPPMFAELACDAQKLGSAARALLEGGHVTEAAQDFADVVQAAEQTVTELIRDGNIDKVASLAVAFLAKEAEERIAAETEKAEIHREGAKEGRA